MIGFALRVLGYVCVVVVPIVTGGLGALWTLSAAVSGIRVSSRDAPFIVMGGIFLSVLPLLLLRPKRLVYFGRVGSLLVQWYGVFLALGSVALLLGGSVSVGVAGACLLGGGVAWGGACALKYFNGIRDHPSCGGST